MNKQTEAMKLALEALEQIKRLTGARWALENNYAGHLEAITALREALAEPQEKYRYGTPLLDAMTGKVQQALDKMAENARELGIQMQPAQQEPVAFLASGTRFKISYDIRQSGGQIHGIPPELGGRWVAFVAADDDCHLKLTSPPAQRTWVGLSDAQSTVIWANSKSVDEAIRATEKQLMENNI